MPGGNFVIRDQELNKEINIVKLNNNYDAATKNCLWSPSGNKNMVSTKKNHSVYIFDETGEKLLKSMENIYSQSGIETVWLSESKVAVEYEDGVVKFLKINEGKQIGIAKANGKYAWEMDCLNDSHFLVGDNTGSITNIDWQNSKIKWAKVGWHFIDCSLICLSLNKDETKLLTCSGDKFVKLMKLQNQFSL